MIASSTVVDRMMIYKKGDIMKKIIKPQPHKNELRALATSGQPALSFERAFTETTLLAIIKEHPGKGLSFYTEKLGCSTSTARNLLRKMMMPSHQTVTQIVTPLGAKIRVTYRALP